MPSDVHDGKADVFSADYFEAAERFRAAARQSGYELESYAIQATGPQGESLTIDVASNNVASDDMLLISSGVHGVEGLFGSAVQLDFLRDAGAVPERVVLIHAMNPYGFAWRRRFDEQNVDLNRNFLAADEAFRGAPPTYGELDNLLNSPTPPSGLDLFLPRALWAVATRGMSSLKQAIAGGQFEFPRGLFYGGAEPTESAKIFREHFDRWLGDAKRIVHLDLHTGLGPFGDAKLLIDYPLRPAQREWLVNRLGEDAFSECESSSNEYSAKGGWGQWCVSQQVERDYLYACVEIGTYGPITVLSGLRKENQLHHWGGDPSPEHPVKRRLQELFCPQSPAWRSRVRERCAEIIRRCRNA